MKAKSNTHAHIKPMWAVWPIGWFGLLGGGWWVVYVQFARVPGDVACHLNMKQNIRVCLNNRGEEEEEEED